MGITIKELSEISGYSAATISRVVSKKGNVKKETREAIEKLLEMYQYSSKPKTGSDAGTDDLIIMVIIGELHSYYYMELLSVIKSESGKYGIRMLIGFTDNSMEEEERYVRMAMEQQYAGLLFINVRGGEALTFLLNHGNIPVVFLNRGIRFADFDAVISDNYRGGYMITSYLIRMGHRKIGHLMGHTYSSAAQERRRGFEDAMKDAALPVTGSSVYVGELTYESGYQYGEYLIKKGLDYTAVFCGNDTMAVGLRTALERAGVRVPEDISLVCYDDTLYAGNAGLTTVGALPEKLASRAMEMLYMKIQGKHAEGGTVVYRPQITERNSVRKII